MSPTEIAGLIIAAAAGGAINAVAGGGTLITFSTLLFFNTPPTIANATSTFALVVGTSGSLFGYRGHVQAVRPWLSRFVPISIAGGLIGGVLLTHTSDRTFSKLVPFLILFATILFLAQGLFRRRTLWLPESRSATVLGRSNVQTASPAEDSKSSVSMGITSGNPSHRAIWAAILFQFAVAIYGGYFGAGIGILMLASLGFIGLANIYQMNTLKTILAALINLAATLWFIFAGLIDWPKAVIMTVGALAGYYLGAHYSQQIPQKRVRQLITAIGFILSAITFYQQFLR